jgi:2,5-diketo-D-gluconate reductase B
MEYVEVQGERVPVLGLGTWQSPDTTCQEAVRHALELGYRHIDTAQAYENEEYVGRGIAESGVDRDDIFLTTKIWRSNMRHDALIDSAHESLRKLGTDYVDLLLLHWPVEEVPFKESLEALVELKEQQKIRHLGVSNYTPRQVDEALETAQIFTNQVEYHPYLAQTDLLEMAEEHNFMLTAYSPLAHGDVVGDERLSEIGEEYGKSAAQVALRWQIQQPRVSTIPKANSAEHREANFDIFDFELTDEEMAEIHQMANNGRRIDPGFAPDWES